MDQLRAQEVFSDDAIAEVTARYPGMRRSGPHAIEGALDIHAIYGDEEVRDSFTVGVSAANPHSDYLPMLHESGGRTVAVASKWKVADLRDLHRNPEGSACVCIRQEERRHFPPGASLLSYIESLAVPYLCGIALFDRDGRWPANDYSHGGLGLLEYYADPRTVATREEVITVFESIRREKNWPDFSKQVRRPSAERQCLCGSGQPIHICHPDAWRGVLHLRDELQRLHISRKDPLSSAKAMKP